MGQGALRERPLLLVYEAIYVPTLPNTILTCIQHPVEFVKLLESGPHLEYHITVGTFKDAGPVKIVPHLGVILCLS